MSYTVKRARCVPTRLSPNRDQWTRHAALNTGGSLTLYKGLEFGGSKFLGDDPALATHAGLRELMRERKISRKLKPYINRLLRETLSTPQYHRWAVWVYFTMRRV
jgi:hypothetical protein